MEGEGSTAWLRSGAPALVVRLLRAAGLAPLRFEPRGVRVSGALNVYGLFFVIVLSTIATFCLVFNILYILSENTAEKQLTATLFRIGEYILTILTYLYGAYSASDRMETWITQVKKIDELKTKLGDHSRADATGRKQLLIVVLSIFFLLFLAVIHIYTFSLYISSTVQVLQCLSIALFIFYYTNTNIFEMQLIITSWHIASLLTSFNKSVQQVSRAVDQDCKDLSGQSIMKESARKHVMTIRELNIIYTEICELVNTMNGGIEGFMMFVCFINSVLHLIAVPYTLINTIQSQTLSALEILQKVLWIMFHFININMVIAPGHYIVQETEQIRMLVGKLIGKADLCTDTIDELFVEIQKLFVTLTLNKPRLSPLGVCTFSRELVLSVLGVSVTYLVILVQFRSNE